MNQYLEVLKFCMLFADISENDIVKLLNCLNTKISKYKKNSTIILTDNEISEIGIVLSGAIQVIKEDYLGNKTILTALSPAETFAETFVCAGVKKSPVTVLSVTECEILFIDYSKIITVCPATCGFHTRLIENMVKLIANKNLLLNQQIEFISKRTIREKLLSYLTAQMNQSKSKRFTIPFSRHALADFLCVDRSAMSRELCKLRDNEILRFKGNEFEMLE